MNLGSGNKNNKLNFPVHLVNTNQFFLDYFMDYFNVSH